MDGWVFMYLFGGGGGVGERVGVGSRFYLYVILTDICGFIENIPAVKFTMSGLSFTMQRALSVQYNTLPDCSNASKATINIDRYMAMDIWLPIFSKLKKNYMAQTETIYPTTKLLNKHVAGQRFQTP